MLIRLLWLCLAFAIPFSGYAEMDPEDEKYYLVLGGKAYDNWMGMLSSDDIATRGLNKADFRQNHPAYPANGKQHGLVTWRCKECHGWDYRGAEGAYSSGSHYTGIKGIQGMRGADPQRVEAILRDSVHRFDQRMIDDPLARAIALFVSQGQIDMASLVEPKTGKALGDARLGRPFFNTLCAGCHGLRGREVNFSTPKKPEYVGTLANKNPWEFLHKIRHGHPGEEMISVQALELQQQGDILSYAQTLPRQ